MERPGGRPRGAAAPIPPRPAHVTGLGRLHAGKGGYMVVHGTSVEIGEDFSASLDDAALHADRMDAKYGDWEDGPYPTI